MTLLAILNVREDLVKKRTTEEILLIGKSSDGKYEVVSHWDNRKKIMISQRDVLLKKFNKFRVYRRGAVIKEIVVTKVFTDSFDCEELIVGTGESKNMDIGINKHKSNNYEISSGFNQHGNFKYKNTRFIAINSNSSSIKTQSKSIPIRYKIKKDTKKQIYDYVSKELLHKNTEIREGDIKITTLLGYNLNKDNKTDYLVVAKAENSKTKESGIFVLNILKNHITSLLNEGMVNSPSSWGNGYELLDVLDLDGDTIPELIFETKGYESTGYEVFKLENNQFLKVFSDTIYGC